MILFAEETVNPLYLGTMLIGAGGIIAFLFKQLITAQKEKYDLLLAEKEAEKKELAEIKESYKQIAAEAIEAARRHVNFTRQQENQPPIVPLAKVVPESNSPPNARQREAALVQTMRADMAQIKLEAGMEPRAESDAPDNPKLTVLEAAVESAVERVDHVSNIVADMKSDKAEDAKTADKVIEKLKEGEGDS